MASKTKVQYVCTECGFESAKWYGKCPSCNAWNMMEEEVRNTTTTGKTYSFCCWQRYHCKTCRITRN